MEPNRPQRGWEVSSSVMLALREGQSDRQELTEGSELGPPDSSSPQAKALHSGPWADLSSLQL